MKIILVGIGGFMGREVEKLCKTSFRGASLVMGIDVNPVASECPCASSFAEAAEKHADLAKNADCIVDFSHHSGTADMLRFAEKFSLPVVLCTTGHTDDEKAMIAEYGKKIAVFNSANMSVGVALLVELAKKAAAAMPDAEIEIIEKHHDRKLDAPSGTALMIAENIKSVRAEAEPVCGRSGMGKRTKSEIGVHSVRMGNIVGEHEVLIGTQNETITLKHEAHSRALFAEGALAAAEFIMGKPAGIYNMNNMIK